MPKTIIVTGASDGIGAAAARKLSIDGHRVVVVGRSPKKTAAVAGELGAGHFVADFASLDSVRALAADIAAAYPRIDVLANNAGGVFGDPTRTVDGHEKTMQVNHLAPFLLTNLLMPVLLRSRASVIQTSSDAARITGRLVVDDLDNEQGRSAVRTYGDAKLANILFTSELHARFGEHGLSSVAFHPGTVATGFASDTASASMRFVYANPLIRRFISTPMTAAAQLVWLAEGDPASDWRSGGYYEKRALARKTNPQAADAALARRLWETSAEMVGL